MSVTRRDRSRYSLFELAQIDLDRYTIDRLRTTKINFIERKPRWKARPVVAGQWPDPLCSGGQALIICPSFVREVRRSRQHQPARGDRH